MFEFYGRFTRAQFVRASAIRIGLFAASVVGFPFLLVALSQVSGCQSIGGACGVVELLAATAFKPLAFVLFVVSFAGISVRRVRDMDLPDWLGLLVPSFFAADWQFLVTAGAPWSLAFSAGVLDRSFPFFTLLGLTGTAILCAMPSGAAARIPDSSGRAGSPVSEPPSSRPHRLRFRARREFRSERYWCWLSFRRQLHSSSDFRTKVRSALAAHDHVGDDICADAGALFRSSAGTLSRRDPAQRNVVRHSCTRVVAVRGLGLCAMVDGTRA